MSELTNVRVLKGLTRTEVKNLFGCDYPTVAERAELTHKLWQAWSPYRVSINTWYYNSALTLLDKNGFVKYRDFIYYYGEFRFPTPDNAVIFSLLAGPDIIKNKRALC